MQTFVCKFRKNFFPAGKSVHIFLTENSFSCHTLFKFPGYTRLVLRRAGWSRTGTLSPKTEYILLKHPSNKGKRTCQTAGAFSILSLLTVLPVPPADEAVQIVDQEHRKADRHGNVGGVFPGGQNPQADEHDIVGGVGEGEPGTAAEGEIGGDEAGGHR